MKFEVDELELLHQFVRLFGAQPAHIGARLQESLHYWKRFKCLTCLAQYCSSCNPIPISMCAHLL